MDTAPDLTTIPPDGAELIRRARALVPKLRERAAQTDQDRMVPRISIDEMQEAGLFKVLQPRRWGGHEMSLDVANDIQITLAEGCMSTAWVFAVLAVEPFLLAIYDDRAAHEVYGKNPSTLVCGTSAATPGVKAVKVDGGFRLSGRWRFASGCDHTDWTFLGAIVPAAEGGEPTAWRFLLPREDYQIVDTWNVSGLKGTGSRDIVVEDKFIPDHRMIRQLDLFNCVGPGLKVNTGPLYRIPFGQVFSMSVSTLAVGGLQGMLNAFLDYGKKRVGLGIGPTAKDPVAQLLCAEAQATIAECKAVFRSNIAELAAYAGRGETPLIADRLRIKFHTAFAVDRANALAARIFRAGGGSAIYLENSPLARLLSDLGAIRQHVNNQVESLGRSWGGLMLGGSESEIRDRVL